MHLLAFAGGLFAQFVLYAMRMASALFMAAQTRPGTVTSSPTASAGHDCTALVRVSEPSTASKSNRSSVQVRSRNEPVFTRTST